MSTSNCLDDSQIAALAAGESCERGALAHIETCTPCRELVSAALATRTEASTGAPRRLAPGTLLGRHRIERPLGAGGMGVVYLARDLELDREVAIKLLRGRDADAHEQLGRESQVLARLNHANVVTAHEVGRHGDASYLVMEYVAGGTVRDWLAAAPRTPDEIAHVYAQAARGLGAAHAAGIVHRDVKPDNVLVGTDARVRISDFGLAGAEMDPHVVAGTPRYMAPEVLAGAPADARSDQWSLAASLWESVFGEPPFRGTTREELAAAIALGLPAFPPRPRTPSWLRRALARGLRVDPAARFGSVDALAEALAPERSPLRRMVPLLVGVAVVASISGAVIGARDKASSCGDELAHVWSPARRAALAQHFFAFGDRGAAAMRVLGPALDRYASLWTAQRAEVCRAETNAPTTIRAAGCLDRRARALDTLVDELSAVDASGLDRAAATPATLPALQDCAAPDRLAGRQPEPRDATSRVRLAALERRFDVALSRKTLAASDSAFDEMRAIADDAEALGYEPLVFEALRNVAMSDSPSKRPAMPSLRHAMAAAQAGGDERQITQAALDLVTGAMRLQRPAAERDELREQAAATVKRLTWRHDPIATAAEAELNIRFGDDDFARGKLDDAERELLHSIDLLTGLYGPRNPYLAPPRTTLAKLANARGDYDRAAVLLAQAVDIDSDSWEQVAGSLHHAEGANALSMIDAAYRLLDVGRDDRALEFLHRARTNLSTGAADATVLAPTLDDLESEIAVYRQDFTTARALNDRALAAWGPNALPAEVAGVHAARGEILEGTGDLTGAEREYRVALAGVTGDDALDIIQVSKVGLARCLAARGDLAAARALVEGVVAQSIGVPRLVPEAWLLAADLRWRTGDRATAREAALKARATLAKLPGLARTGAAVDAWLASHAEK